MINRPSGPPWVKCLYCENPWCTLHDVHAYDCPCPPVEEWPKVIEPPEGEETNRGQEGENHD